MKKERKYVKNDDIEPVDYVVRSEERPSLPLRTTVHGFGSTTVHRRLTVPVARTGWRVYWFPDGGYSVEFRGCRYDADPGMALVIPPYTPILHVLHRPALHYWFHVNYGPPFDSVEGVVMTVPATEWFRNTIKRIRGLERGSHTSVFLATSLATWVAGSLPEDVWPDAPTDPRVRKAQRRMQRNPGDKTICNDSLARDAGLSRDAFLRLFRQQVGMPPTAYLIRCRLDRACALLLGSDDSIDQVAEVCGFGVRSYMSRMFKEKLGSSPAAFRKGVGGENG